MNSEQGGGGLGGGVNVFTCRAELWLNKVFERSFIVKSNTQQQKQVEAFGNEPGTRIKLAVSSYSDESSKDLCVKNSFMF